MSAVAFDTLKLARQLRDTAEMTQAQAEGVAGALAEAMSGAELATKTDIVVVRNELKAEITAVRNELKADIAAVRNELKADIATVRNELKADIATVRNDLVAVEAGLKAEIAHCATKADVANAAADVLRWVFAAVVGQMALLVAFLKFWH